MLDYTKPESVARVIPRTFGRYSIDCRGNIYDAFYESPVEWAVEDGVFVFPQLGTIYDGTYSPEEVVCLTYKPLYIPEHLLGNAVLLTRANFDDPFNTCNPRGYVWCFPDGCELPTYPGFRVIPGFSRYVASRDGVVISTLTGERLMSHVANTGYPACRLLRDDDCSKVVSVHVLIALAWCCYDENICNMQVDHIDGDRANYNADNLEWVPAAENVRRARIHRYHNVRGRKTWARDIRSGEKLLFDSPADVARYFNVGKSSVFGHLNSSNPHAVFRQTHLVWYDGFGDGEIHPEHLIAREGSQRRPVLVKSISTGDIKRYVSVSEFMDSCALTRKQVYVTLKQGLQRRYGDIIFKYEDDETPWKL